MLIESRLKVSVWMAQHMEEAVFQNYIVEEDQEADGPTNLFAKDLGSYSIDPDDLDGKFSKQSVSIEKLINPLAYAYSFSAAVVEAAAQKGLSQANTVVAVYGHEFQGAWPKKSPLKFIGSFDFIPVSKRESSKSAAAKLKNYCYLEYENLPEGIRKFWSIELSGLKHLIRHGQIGFRGKETTREFPDKQTARAQFEKAIQGKEKAGYQVRPGASTKRR
jgi:predicted DNA-binding WGR domain protein